MSAKLLILYLSAKFLEINLQKPKKTITFLQPLSAQMLESVDKSVSNTDAERRAGSTPALGTSNIA